MLELRNICKEYRTGDSVQTALDHVNLTLSDMEFVAILGPSGAGKTTLLNIIGGLDRYDSGDLIIDGISTRNYSDRDWDAYRNRAVGFVFQNYNLIMHQSVLSNVELALTISGITGEERRRRAEDALRRVGLGSHMSKKPNQLSGGQMQRVAIARALVNDPSIVLADEPTGALDSDTSIQVMELLKKVSRRRLVVMVTHNPELAEKYATRIVTIRDGHFAGSRDLPQNRFSPEDLSEKNTGDSNAGQEPPLRQDSVKNGRFRRTSMTFFTALALSFQNLRTKKARTFMVAFAGSIGIIGIALIMAIETGLQQYIKATEKATLSQYPIEIYSTGIDWSSLLTEGYGNLFASSTNTASGQENVSSGSDEIAVNTLAKNIFTGMNKNDLASFKKYLESGESEIPDYAADIEYNYGIEPQIYRLEKDGSADQLNPNRMLSDMLTSIIDVSSLMNGFVGESLFHAMPSDPSLYEASYEVRAGRWPRNNHELVLVLTGDGRTSDFMLYELGILDPEELRQMIRQFSSGSGNSILDFAQNAAAAVGADSSGSSSSSGSAAASSSPSDSASAVSSSSGDGSPVICTYSDFIGKTFKLVLNSDTYTYDSQMKVWSSQTDNEAYMKNLIQNGEDLTIVGIVQPKNGASDLMLSSGIGYPRGLVNDIMKQERQSEPVKAQLADPDTNIFTGKKFSDPSSGAFDFGSMITLDHDDVAKAFHVNTDAADSDTMQNYLSAEIDKMSGQIIQYASQEAEAEMSGISLDDFLDPDELEKQIPQLSGDDLKEILKAASASLSGDAVQNAVRALGEGYTAYLGKQLEDPDTRKAYEESLAVIFRPVTDYVSEYLKSDAARSVIEEQFQDFIRQNAALFTPEKIQAMLQEEIQAYLTWVAQQNAERPADDQLSADNPLVIQLYLSGSEGQQRISALAASVTSQAAALSKDQLLQLADALAQSFDSYAAQNTMPNLSDLSRRLADNLTGSLADYLSTEDAQNTVMAAVSSVISESGLQRAVSGAVKEKLSDAAGQTAQGITEKINRMAARKLQSFAEKTASQAKQIVLDTISGDYPQIAEYINRNIGDFFTVNEDLFRKAIRVDAGVSELQSILTSFLNSGKATLTGNLTELGWADPESPAEILIYPEDFSAKNKIADLITDYNNARKSSGEKDKVITYSDVVATMMQSVTDIIDSVSRILMAFVSISLVVSSIMIGVITYISVLERKKEIGILRAIGASRHNVREVFNAETSITGFLSGCLGIGITYALVPLATALIRQKTGQMIRAALPPLMAAGLILLSVFLTLLAGLIPSGQAARSDPVAALRSE